MKKLIIIIFLLIIMSGCKDLSYVEDPLLRESERIAINEKIKTDTLSTIIEMDKRFYVIKGGKIEKAIPTENLNTSVLLVSLFIGVVVGLLIGISFKD